MYKTLVPPISKRILPIKGLMMPIETFVMLGFMMPIETFVMLGFMLPLETSIAS
jgi:hypothetical protein